MYVCICIFTVYIYIYIILTASVLFFCLESNNNVTTTRADPSYHLTDEDTQALLSLHDTFQKCVVRFPSLCFYAFNVFVFLRFQHFMHLLDLVFSLWILWTIVANFVFYAECKWTWPKSNQGHRLLPNHNKFPQ